jgi:acetylornithine deacetylase/succinyl-diaminopimelate desuccinylase-like protein
MNPQEYAEQQRESHLQMLKQLVAQPSVSPTGEGVLDCALLLTGMMEEAGIRTELLPTPGWPVVYGEVDAGAPLTILFYGHYDVQPPEPLELWESPPFAPTVRNGRLYGRGTGDNKGQLLANLLAVRAFLKTGTPLPVNVRFCFEGEEESSSLHLPWAVEQYREKLKTDLVYTADGPKHPSERPTIFLGVRGIQYVEVNAYGAARDNHSGNRGGAVPNPAWALVHLLAAMKGPDGQVRIPGFYDRIRPLSDHDRKLLESLPYDPAEAAAAAGMARLELSAADYYRRTMLEPTLNIAGFTSGYGGPGSKTIIPAQATVKIDMRLVADQDPADIYRKFVRFVESFPFPPGIRVEVKDLHGMEPSRTPGERPEPQAVVRAARRAYGEEPLVLPSLGGSLPNYVWTRILGVPAVNVAYANSDQGNHGPNENIALDCFWDGIRCSIAVLEELGKPLYKNA